MPHPQAYLVDVYETVLTCDFGAHAAELPALAGVSLEDFRTGLRTVNDPATDGRLTMVEAMAAILTACGRTPDLELAADLARRDRELLIEHSRLHDDAVPFLEHVRSRGASIALVSNCADNTMPLLEAVGLTSLVDAIVLSCDEGCAKPSPAIYRRALDQLGAAPEDAVFVDDQAAFCAGAVALGMRAVQIVRGRPQPDPPPQGTVRVDSLREIHTMFGGATTIT